MRSNIVGRDSRLRPALAALALLAACSQTGGGAGPPASADLAAKGADAEADADLRMDESDVEPEDELPSVVLAGGCFWCTEAVFQDLAGVVDVVSGYAGGTAETASYDTVSGGRTGHAESIRITYDPDEIGLDQLLDVFFTVAHDPTQLDRQGPDRGTQYRSAIFYADEEQRRVAEATIARLTDAGTFDAPIVTTLEPLGRFFPAEGYHQDYVERNPYQPYVERNAQPKRAKLRDHFPDLVIPDEE